MKKISIFVCQDIIGGMDNPAYTIRHDIYADGQSLVICKKENDKIYLLLAGAQGVIPDNHYGAAPINVLLGFNESAKLEIDFMCSGKHKGFLSLQASEVPFCFEMPFSGVVINL